MSEGGYFEGAAQELLEQSKARRGSSRALSKEAARSYADLLDDLFFFYRESIRPAEQGTTKG